MKTFGREQLQELLATLAANKLRTALTGFAVGWGILLLVVLLSAGTGLSNAINREADKLGMTLEEVEMSTGWVSIPHGSWVRWAQISLTQPDLDFLRTANHEDITALTAYQIAYYQRLEANGIAESRDVYGVEGAYGNIRALRLVTSGSRFISERDQAEARKVVVIPEGIAKALYNDADKALGQELSIQGIIFRIVGVSKDTNGSWSSLYIPLSTMQMLWRQRDGNKSPASFDGAIMLCPRIKTQDDCDELQRRLCRQLSARLGTSPEDENLLRLSSRAAGNDMMQSMTLGIDIFLWVIGLSTLVIGLVGVVNIMQITVAERKREIGVRKALGAKPWDIIVMILSESVLVTLISGLAGLSVGVGLMALVDRYLVQQGIGQSQIEGMELTLFLNPVINLPTAVGALLVMIIGGILAGYLPARKAVRIPVVEAMRS